ncbi:MAG: addiction module protein [Myxococcaceae bacterium]|jgi:putative addiction module component (TIGR02574 family)|nr:addiction module protein [Myxococcaceae bacterium]
MGEKAQQLLSEALKLSGTERAQLITELLETLDTPEGVEAAWTSELRRRLAEIRAGRAELLDWQDARAELHGNQ